MTREEYIKSHMDKVTKELRDYGHWDETDNFREGMVIYILVENIFGGMYDALKSFFPEEMNNV